MKLALAQINTTVGDFSGNVRKILEWTDRASQRGAQLVLFPELTVHGYPPRDLLEFPDFVEGGQQALDELAGSLAGGPAVLVGFVETAMGNSGVGRHNALAWLEAGSVQVVARKTLLPNYDVFDERRYFDPAGECRHWKQGSHCWGMSICEDLWNDEADPNRLYERNPWQEYRDASCDWVLNASASPYHQGKPTERRAMFVASARRHGMGLALCNLVGGNDSLLFDGNSLVVDARGQVLAQGAAFEEDLLVVDVDQVGGDQAAFPSESGKGPSDAVAEVWQGLVVGVRDYARKTGFSRVVVGLSGGIDSSVTVAVAAEALGSSQVLGVAMPSQFTSSMSDDDARILAENLGIGFEVIPIEPLTRAYDLALESQWGGTEPNVAEENLQARIRGNLLLGISNKHGHLVLTTGNKSEMAVGYCTLYGDMAGGLAVIGDCSKTLVYELARHVNRAGEVIPDRVLTRPPTAELRPDQKDEDSLPPYEELDPLLQAIIVERRSRQEMLDRGVSEQRWHEVHSLLIRAEYKRRQAALALRVSPAAFGEGWRFPISHGWHP